MYHLLYLVLGNTGIYFHSMRHHSSTPWLLCHLCESHHYSCRLPLILQSYCCMWQTTPLGVYSVFANPLSVHCLTASVGVRSVNEHPVVLTVIVKQGYILKFYISDGFSAFYKQKLPLFIVCFQCHKPDSGTGVTESAKIEELVFILVLLCKSSE